MNVFGYHGHHQQQEKVNEFLETGQGYGNLNSIKFIIFISAS